MSENNNKQQADESRADSDDNSGGQPAAVTEAAEPAPTAAAAAAPEPASAPAADSDSGSGSGGGSAAVGWLALVLVLAVGGGAGWSVMQGMEREQTLKRRIAELETRAAPAAPVEVDVEGAMRSLERTLDERLQTALQQLRRESDSQSEQLEQLTRQLQTQGERLASFSANDHQSWLRAEVQYLLRLANQRVIMARDTQSALVLLASADSILQQLDDVTMHEVRAAIAAEQAALRAVPKVDVEGIYLRLSALIEQADSLVIFQMPEQEDQVADAGQEEDDWQVRLERGYEEAARKLSDYIVIRRRDVPMHALMDPQWEGLVRQNLRMLLEQAQVALLSGNQTLYVESLQRSQHWVAQFFDTDEVAARAMSREIDQLESRTVQVVMPDLSRSLRALDVAAKQRRQQGGAE
ncbi:uroporphyrinogen III [Seongchinamella sediminis]|uniref:Uroporphyrinogen III n=1 Tax=Seongchinamella sediminis TaxID=2283635 RepID=A0A3L7DYP0_9GAMM|nr:uroporphyrinogen-III C-methyltransferase [Seongchinamella sediminis]RLQ20982.1 uroporphyrinogen III [Seongchinamella sediminis]